MNMISQLLTTGKNLKIAISCQTFRKSRLLFEEIVKEVSLEGVIRTRVSNGTDISTVIFGQNNTLMALPFSDKIRGYRLDGLITDIDNARLLEKGISCSHTSLFHLLNK